MCGTSLSLDLFKLNELEILSCTECLSEYMCVCIYIYIHIYIYIYIYTHTHICVCAYICVCVCVEPYESHSHACMHVCMYTSDLLCFVDIRTREHHLPYATCPQRSLALIKIYTYIHIYIYTPYTTWRGTRMHVCMYVCVCMYTYSALWI